MKEPEFLTATASSAWCTACPACVLCVACASCGTCTPLLPAILIAGGVTVSQAASTVYTWFG